MLSLESAPRFPAALLAATSARLEKFNFRLSRELLRGLLFEDDQGTALLVDYLICDRTFPFEYPTYSDEQNRLMHQYPRVYRAMVDSESELDALESLLANLGSRGYEDGSGFGQGATNRERTSVDPTVPEAYFEDAFIETFGREYLESISREYPVIDLDGSCRFVDYYLEVDTGNIAIEKNGISYHHPQLIGKERYASQLLKQNSLVAYGAKLYRWSLDSMKFSERFKDELRLYLGDPRTFKAARKLSVTRSFKLLKHQDSALESLALSRLAGEKAALVVLPTGTGKTEILIADYSAAARAHGALAKALVMVPTVALKYQAIEAFRQRLPDHGIVLEGSGVGSDPEAQVVVQTYAWMCRHQHDFAPDAFQYLAVDEAHHAVAPTLRKVIQRFNPEFLVGLTATDQRLDAVRLEDVFGRYEAEMTLKQAIESEILAPIRAFRLESNVDLSEVRFNGKDYVNADLEKTVIVPSRNQLIVDTLRKYFVDSGLEPKSGLIFCVSVKHAEDLAALMLQQGLSAASVSGSDPRSRAKIADYQEGKIQFLTTCSLLNEGWDSPRTSILVMARPTLSKVLYTQQLGRGTRKFPGKEALYVIDVVDTYGALGSMKNTPWSLHAILACSTYAPWGNPLKTEDRLGPEAEVIAGLFEGERAMRAIDIFTFEYQYPDHLSDEQMARELFVGTDTLKGWVKAGKVVPSVTVPFGKILLNYYDPAKVEEIRGAMKLKVHDETTLLQDFEDFLDKRDYVMSYKMIMMLCLLKLVDAHGECDLTALTEFYQSFYLERHRQGLAVDKPKCPYTPEFLAKPNDVKRSLLQFPFEKFERKRFLYHCKDLNRISFSGPLWGQMDEGRIASIRHQMLEDLVKWYRDLDGVPDLERWKVLWDAK